MVVFPIIGLKINSPSLTKIPCPVNVPGQGVAVRVSGNSRLIKVSFRAKSKLSSPKTKTFFVTVF